MKKADIGGEKVRSRSMGRQKRRPWRSRRERLRRI